MLEEKKIETEKLSNEIGRIVERWGFTGDKKAAKILDVNAWLHNFDAPEIPIIYHLLHRVNLQGDDEINNCLDKISDQMRKDFGENINKIRIHALGESPASSGAPYLYSLRKKLGLAEKHFPNKPNKSPGNSIAYVFIDDFIGSGRQATRYFEDRLATISIPMHYYSLYGYKKGIDYIKEKTPFKVYVGEELNSTNKIFSDSTDFPFKEECREIALKYGLRLYPKHPLGYEDSQSMICFKTNCPNNTLPIIWAGPKSESEFSTWQPLFERNQQKKDNPNFRNELAKTQKDKDPCKLVTYFYELIENKKPELAFDCLSANLKNDKYKNGDVKYFAAGYRNTIEISNLIQRNITTQVTTARCLVHYSEKVKVFEWNHIEQLHSCNMKDLNRVMDLISRFKAHLKETFQVEDALLDAIPLAHFFSINVVEELCWYCQIPYDLIEKHFSSRDVTMYRAKYIDCKRKDKLWYIDKIHTIMHSSEAV